MKLRRKKREEKGITIVGLIILLAIIAFIVVIMSWAFGLSKTVQEKTKRHETIDFMQSNSSFSIKY